MTLLVLHLAVQGPASLGGSGLSQELLSLWPSFVAYLTSFMTILIMWINHHNLFSLVKRVDRPFLFYNGILLLFTTFSYVANCGLFGASRGPFSRRSLLWHSPTYRD
jgi:uncharacterized membrane protein